MKYCQYCGIEMEENAKFCPSCGEAVEQDMFASSMGNNRVKNSSNYQLETVLGILGVIFSVLNYMGVFFVHLIGIVLGIVVISLVNKDKKMNRQYSQIGYVTGIIGLILGVLAVIIGISMSF